MRIGYMLDCMTIGIEYARELGEALLDAVEEVERVLDTNTGRDPVVYLDNFNGKIVSLPDGLTADEPVLIVVQTTEVAA
jgi:hypothetical protein